MIEQISKLMTQQIKRLTTFALVTPDHIVRATARDAVKQQYEG